MDKELRRREGAKILRFRLRDASRPAERAGSPARGPEIPEAGFDADSWYHQDAIDETRERAKQ